MEFVETERRERRLEMKKKGFSLLELIMVIVVLGLLVGIAVMKYVDMRNHAKQAAEEYTVRSVQSGIFLYGTKEELDEQ